MSDITPMYTRGIKKCKVCQQAYDSYKGDCPCCKHCGKTDQKCPYCHPNHEYHTDDAGLIMCKVCRAPLIEGTPEFYEYIKQQPRYEVCPTCGWPDTAKVVKHLADRIRKIEANDEKNKLVEWLYKRNPVWSPSWYQSLVDDLVTDGWKFTKIAENESPKN